jgi:endogenous inhibitor of DNA gyrase (YacG/DUF329 family)
MTEYQARQIRDYRMKGVGYRAIAEVVGMSRDGVRSYCKHHGLDGVGSVLTINMKEQIQKGVACQCCGKPVKQPSTGRKRKFCSDKCRRQWWSEHPGALQKKESAVYRLTCAYCGSDFESYGNKARKYCCHECYVRDRFWREEDGREPYVSPAKKEVIGNE